VAGLQPTSATFRPVAGRVTLLAGSFLLALAAAWGFPRLDRDLNPDAASPGLISFLGVGLVVLALTMLLLLVGLRGLLPKTAVFLAAALGYNALLIVVKFGFGPAALYTVNFTGPGFQYLTNPLAYPGLAAITAVLYGMAFFLLYVIFRSGLQRRLGIPVVFERRLVQLFVVMFVLSVVGWVTLVGLLGFLEYSTSVLLGSAFGVLIGIALVGAIILCSISFREASDQSMMLRNVSVLGSFAWIGLAFIAAYHILWLVFLLTLVSLWPLRSYTVK
jgi:hypothetical protein